MKRYSIKESGKGKVTNLELSLVFIKWPSRGAQQTILKHS